MGRSCTACYGCSTVGSTWLAFSCRYKRNSSTGTIRSLLASAGRSCSCRIAYARQTMSAAGVAFRLVLPCATNNRILSSLEAIARKATNKGLLGRHVTSRAAQGQLAFTTATDSAAGHLIETWPSLCAGEPVECSRDGIVGWRICWNTASVRLGLPQEACVVERAESRTRTSAELRRCKDGKAPNRSNKRPGLGIRHHSEITFITMAR